jgi:thiamine-phosphate pyrophosphorylase
MLVTERTVMHPSTQAALQSALESGARLIQLREKEQTQSEVLRLARDAKALCDKFGAQLLINTSFEIAREVGAGLHVPESEIANLAAAREQLGDGVLVGASAHSLETARYAQSEGADYIVFGSVFKTASHVGSTPVGIEALREVCEAMNVPVFAIGGITTQNARDCMNAGAHGVAVIRAVWSTPDVGAAVRDFLESLGD